jgi:hypothetical protein
MAITNVPRAGKLIRSVFKPFTHSLYVDLAHDPDQEPQPIYLGFRSGRNVV